MSSYILVEGRRSESKIYPKWISYIKPDYTRVFFPGDATESNYFLVSGYGYPNILNQVQSSLEDIKENPAFENFIIIIDREEEEVEVLKNFIQGKVLEVCRELGIKPKLMLIIQIRSIETWLLGNKAIFKRNPHDPKLIEYIKYFRVDIEDPELMGK